MFFLKTIILIALSLSYFLEVKGQSASIFQTLSLDSNTLSLDQQEKYRKISRNIFFKNAQFIRVDDLVTVQDSGRVLILLNSLNCDTLIFNAKTVNYENADNYYWYGEILNESDNACNDGTLTMMSINGEKFGHLKVDSNQYEYHHLGDNIQLLAQKNDSLLRTCSISNEESLTPNFSLSNLGGTTCEGECVVRVFVFYTDAAFKSEVNMENRIALSIAQTNQAFINSKVGKGLQLVLSGISLLPNFTEVSSDDDLYTFAGRPDVHNMLTTTESDITVLFRTQVNYFDFYGSAFIGPNSSSPYAVVITGARSADEYTFAHEVGHLFGCLHQRPQGATTFQHGYEFNAGFLGFLSRNTIMAPLNSQYSGGGKVILNYSNPSVKHRSKPTGEVDKADNARKLNYEGCEVASFFPNPTAPLSGILSGYDVVCACKSADFWVTAECGSPPYSYSWEISWDGIYFNPAGNSDRISLRMLCTTLHYFFVRITITDANNHNFTLQKSVLVVPTWSVRTCDEFWGLPQPE